MLNRKLGTNEVTLLGSVAQVEPRGLQVKVNSHYFYVEFEQVPKSVMEGSFVEIKGTYSFENKKPLIRASHWSLVEPAQDSVTGTYWGHIAKRETFGNDRSSAWASVILKATHKHAYTKNEVSTSILKVNLSNESLETISFDLAEGDALGLSYYLTNVEETPTFKCTNITSHYPKTVIEFYNSDEYMKLRFK